MSYVHHIPGRLRVRSAAIKKNQEKASVAKRLLESAPGVRSVEVNTLTGSIVVQYDTHATNPPALMRTLRERGYLGYTDTLGRPTTFAPRRSPALSSDVGGQIARKVASYVVEAAVERSLAALVAAVL